MVLAWVLCCVRLQNPFFFYSHICTVCNNQWGSVPMSLFDWYVFSPRAHADLFNVHTTGLAQVVSGHCDIELHYWLELHLQQKTN